MKCHCVIRLKLLRIERALNELRAFFHLNNYTSSIFVTSNFADYSKLSELDEISDKLTGKLQFDVVLIVNSAARFPELSYRT